MFNVIIKRDTIKKYRNTNCLNCFNSNCIFQGIASEEGLDVDYHRVANTYSSSQDLFLRGNPSFGVYIVKRGSLISKFSSWPNQKNQINLHFPGEIIGSSIDLELKNHKLSAKVFIDAEICFFDKGFFKKSILKNLAIRNRYLKWQSNQSIRSEKNEIKRYDLASDQRLSWLIIKLFKNIPTHHKRDYIFSVNDFTLEVISSFTGNSLDEIKKSLNSLALLGFLELRSNRINVLDVKKLEKYHHTHSGKVIKTHH